MMSMALSGALPMQRIMAGVIVGFYPNLGAIL
jgi:hypothetical protein